MLGKTEGLVGVTNLTREIDVNGRGVTPSDGELQAAARLKVALRPTGKIVAVTGLDLRDGATLLAAGLGAALSALDHERILVVDANVRAPQVHEAFGIPRTPGLLDVLDRKVALKTALNSAGSGNLFVLPAGDSTETLGSLLSSPEGIGIMKQIAEQFRYIVIDAGLIHSSPEAMLIASMCDGVVAALAAGTRRRDEVVAFQEELAGLKIPLLGVVLTRAH